MTKIILTRHGHVEGIEPERFRGRAELPLNARGLHEAKAVAKAVARSAAIGILAHRTAALLH